MELRSEYNAVRVINRKKIFKSVLVGALMTTCISCSIMDEEIKVKFMNKNFNLCDNNTVSLSDNNIYLNSGKGPQVSILHTEKNNVELLLKKNDSKKNINAEINSKIRINDTLVQICSINDLKNEITIASTKKITSTPYKDDIKEIYVTGLSVLIFIAMMLGSSISLNSENTNKNK